MCFSAPVSFAASGVIGAIGIATLAIPKKKNEIAFSLIPIIFAIHQFVEGLVWTFPENIVFRYIFIIIALVLWPTFMPLSVYFLEKKENKIHKKVLLGISILGGLVSLSTLGVILSDTVTLSIACNALSYNLGVPNIPYYEMIIRPILQTFYVSVTIGGIIASGYKRVRLFGILMLISFIITCIFYYAAYFSVWCFFCAVLSMVIYYFFRTKYSKQKIT